MSLVLTARSSRGMDGSGGGRGRADARAGASVSFLGEVSLVALPLEMLVYGDMPARGVSAGAVARGVARGESQGVVSMLGVTWVRTNIKLSSRV